MMIPISLDAGVDQRLDPVEEHGFVGDRHQLLRRGVGDRAQPRAGAAGEDQSLQVLHWREAIVPHPVSASRSVAVVIPNWNSLQHLARCLGSLEKRPAASPEIELLVVDNGSADGSVEYLEREGVPHIALPRQHRLRRRRQPRRLADRGGLDPRAQRRHRARAGLPSAALLGGARGRPGPRRRAAAHPAARRGRDRRASAARIYSAGQSLTRDGRGIEEGAGLLQQPRAPGGERTVRRLRRRLPAAPRALLGARRLRRELRLLLRGRRPQRAGADRRLALRDGPRGGRLARRQRRLAGGLRRARAPRTRAWSPATGSPPRSSSCRRPRSPGSPRSRPAPWRGASPSAASRPRRRASWKRCGGCRRCAASGGGWPAAATSARPAPGSAQRQGLAQG